MMRIMAIEKNEEAGFQKYLIKLNEEDYGRVIGKGGKVIRAIRKLAQVRAIKEQFRVRIELVEDK